MIRIKKNKVNGFYVSHQASDIKHFKLEKNLGKISWFKQ